MAPPLRTKPTDARMKPVGQPKTTAPAPKAPIMAHSVPREERPGPIDLKDIASVSIGPPTITYYLPIPLGGTTPTPPVTGVFLPNGYPYLKEVDVILYFHGNRAGGPKTWKFDTIDEYWAGNYPGGETPVKLRENLNSAVSKGWVKRPVLLIAPTLGPYPGAGSRSSDLGTFDQQAIDASGGFLEQVFAELAKREPKTKGTKVGRVILAGHSGGGVPLIRQLELMQGSSTTICEAWMFDGIYVSTDRWNTVIRRNPDTDFYFHFGTPPQKKYARAVMNEYDEEVKEWEKNTMDGEFDGDVVKRVAANASFIPGPEDDHFGALTQNFSTRLKEAACLK